MSEKVSAEIKVSGLVQGVGYRWFVYRNAINLGLRGIAENMYDGSVKVIAVGPKASIEELVKELKVGPSRSIIERVLVTYGDYIDTYKEFSIG
jgi:acylphosphatase